MTFSLAVPTSSVIAIDANDPFKVCVIEQNGKHNGRLTLVGGKVEMPKQSHLQCAYDEWDQEAGGKGAKLIDLTLWAIKTDEHSDVRPATLGKLTHNFCPPELASTPVIGHYGAPDYIYVGKVDGIPYPLDGEAKQCLFIDVRDVIVTASESESRYGAQHDLILVAYRLSLQGRPVDNRDFADFRALRAELARLTESVA
ncbi:MAG: hypothetical protein IAF58_18230 [Leptolyngbya sp.]|nr:hypothetical protein [Candidatus Melainabacteria bacterium]